MKPYTESDSYSLSDEVGKFKAKLEYIHGKRRIAHEPLKKRKNKRFYTSLTRSINNKFEESGTSSSKGNTTNETCFSFWTFGKTKFTTDLKKLVILLTRETLMQELAKVQEPIGDDEVTGMRLQSLILTIDKIIEDARTLMISSAVNYLNNIIREHQFDVVEYPILNCPEFPRILNEDNLKCIPADASHVDKTAVAGEYVQAQRGNAVTKDADDMIFESDYLYVEKAAEVNDPELYKRIWTGYRKVIQKLVELNFIEKDQHTLEQVEQYLRMSDSDVKMSIYKTVVQTAEEQGPILAQNILKVIIDTLYKQHQEDQFRRKPVYVMKKQPTNTI